MSSYNNFLITWDLLNLWFYQEVTKIWEEYKEMRKAILKGSVFKVVMFLGP